MKFGIARHAPLKLSVGRDVLSHPTCGDTRNLGFDSTHGKGDVVGSVLFDDVTLRYSADRQPALDGFTLDIEEGEFLVLVGPSGSGKSTALRILAGLERPTSGTVLVDGEDVTRVEPAHRDLAMVFQNYALYPHKSVEDNMSFSLQLAKVPRDEIRRRVSEAAELLELSDLLRRRPRELSGGQRQRVAMGRAIVREPTAFLMDEPLSNLDATLRVQTRSQIAALQKRLGTTTVYVTHDQAEAMTLGHRVAVLRDGRLHQVAPPRELYERPVNAFVAGFIGSPAMNLLDLSPEDLGRLLGGSAVPAPASAGTASVIIGVRPEHLAVEVDGGGLPLRIELIEELGADAFIHGQSENSRHGQRIVARLLSDARPAMGDVVRVSTDPSRLHFFDRETELRIDV